MDNFHKEIVFLVKLLKKMLLVSEVEQVTDTFQFTKLEILILQ